MEQSEVERLLDEFSEEQKEITTNQDRIGNLLADFIVGGSSVGYGLYNEINGLGKDKMEIPDKEEIQNDINVVRTDAEEVRRLQLKLAHIIELCEEENAAYKKELQDGVDEGKYDAEKVEEFLNSGKEKWDTSKLIENVKVLISSRAA